MNFSHLKSPSGFQLLQMGTLLEKTKMSLLKEKKQLFRLMVLLFQFKIIFRDYFLIIVSRNVILQDISRELPPHLPTLVNWQGKISTF